MVGRGRTWKDMEVRGKTWKDVEGRRRSIFFGGNDCNFSTKKRLIFCVFLMKSNRLCEPQIGALEYPRRVAERVESAAICDSHNIKSVDFKKKTLKYIKKFKLKIKNFRYIMLLNSKNGFKF